VSIRLVTSEVHVAGVSLIVVGKGCNLYLPIVDMQLFCKNALS